MNGIAVFDYTSWSQIFPELGQWTNSAQATQYWNEATMLLDNTAASPVQDVNMRTTLLNLLSAHVCALRQPLGGEPSSQLVGRINQATQGSVTVQSEMNTAPGSAQYYNQTKYGSQYWQMVLPFRSARYAPGCRRIFSPVGFR